MSGHSAEERFVIVADARRRRTRAEKEGIVAELLASGATVSAIARKHNVAPSLLFRWRRLHSSKGAGEPKSADRAFVPIALPAPADTRPSVTTNDSIEIVLAGGRRVIVGKDVDVTVLRRVIETLEPR